jgi:hypothetical protein
MSKWHPFENLIQSQNHIFFWGKPEKEEKAWKIGKEAKFVEIFQIFFFIHNPILGDKDKFKKWQLSKLLFLSIQWSHQLSLGPKHSLDYLLWCFDDGIFFKSCYFIFWYTLTFLLRCQGKFQIWVNILTFFNSTRITGRYAPQF